MTGRAAIEVGVGLLVTWAISFVVMYLWLCLVAVDVTE